MRITKIKASIKKIIIIVKYVLIFIACLFGSIIAYSFIPNSPKQDLFFIKNAYFAKNSLESKDNLNNCSDSGSKKKFLVQRHHIAPGSGIILAFRWFHNPYNNITDDEIFKKLTIWINDINESNYHFGETNKIKAYYTEGNSAFPNGNCGGELTTGDLNILTNEEQTITAQVHFSLKCFTINGTEKRSINFSKIFEFQKRNYEDLTPWLGGTSNNEVSIYRETYRK